jgi:hypothetical protein
MVTPGQQERRFLALVGEEKLRMILRVMLDEREFLSPYGINLPTGTDCQADNAVTDRSTEDGCLSNYRHYRLHGHHGLPSLPTQLFE